MLNGLQTRSAARLLNLSPLLSLQPGDCVESEMYLGRIGPNGVCLRNRMLTLYYISNTLDRNLDLERQPLATNKFWSHRVCNAQPQVWGSDDGKELHRLH